MSLSSIILKLFGWKIRCSVPDYPKCIICVAPHTSNWDFVLGKLTYWSLGRKAGFLIKENWFFFPMNLVFNAFGGIPVPRRKHNTSLTDVLIKRFNSSTEMSVAITPEGTRSKVSEWHTGFLRIATGAGVPIVLGAIDAADKTVYLERTFIPTGDIEADMAAIKDYYRHFKGIKADNFAV